MTKLSLAFQGCLCDDGLICNLYLLFKNKHMVTLTDGVSVDDEGKVLSL
jgi:hypothetical protein